MILTCSDLDEFKQKLTSYKDEFEIKLSLDNYQINDIYNSIIEFLRTQSQTWVILMDNLIYDDILNVILAKRDMPSNVKIVITSRKSFNEIGDCGENNGNSILKINLTGLERDTVERYFLLSYSDLFENDQSNLDYLVSSNGIILPFKLFYIENYLGRINKVLEHLEI